MEASQGNTATLVKVLQRAAKAAIIDRTEQVLLTHIKDIGVFSPPPVARGRKIQRRRKRR
jgi:hypothetical protein